MNKPKTKVRIDTLKPGQWFNDLRGRRWEYMYPSVGPKSESRVVMSDRGKVTVFMNHAIVEVEQLIGESHHN